MFSVNQVSWRLNISSSSSGWSDDQTTINISLLLQGIRALHGIDKVAVIANQWARGNDVHMKRVPGVIHRDSSLYIV